MGNIGSRWRAAVHQRFRCLLRTRRVARIADSSDSGPSGVANAVLMTHKESDQAEQAGSIVKTRQTLRRKCHIGRTRHALSTAMKQIRS